MSRSTRRAFLGQLGSAALIPGIRHTPFGIGPEAPSFASAQAAAAQGASYDLLIQGGRVIDPSQKISAVRDVAIAGGRIARVAENIPPAQARQVYDATGKIVTPGPLDMHTNGYRLKATCSADS